MNKTIEQYPIATVLNTTDWVLIQQPDGYKCVAVANLLAGLEGATGVTSVNSQTGIVVLTKADLGLGSVDNTSDADKPVSTAQATAIGSKIASELMGVANGVATLGADGKIPVSQIGTTITGAGGAIYSTYAAMQAATPTVITLGYVLDASGDSTVTSGAAGYLYDPDSFTWNKMFEAESMDLVLDWANIQNRPDLYTSTQVDDLLSGKVTVVSGKGLSANDFTDVLLAKLNAIAAGAQVNAVNSVQSRTGDVVITKTDLGLDSVDNTADVDKPVSTATQTALDNKVASSLLGVANGVATLDSAGKVPLSQLSSTITGAAANVYATYAAMQADAPTTVVMGYVLDASGDESVTSGAAGYLYDPDALTWNKLFEAESMDVILDWANIQNKPTLYSQSEVDNLLSDKVDKIAGKGLSANDFTNDLYQQLSNTMSATAIETALLGKASTDLSSTSGSGLLPALSGSGTQFLNGLGQWATPDNGDASGIVMATAGSVADITTSGTSAGIYGVDTGGDDNDNGIYLKFAQGDVRKAGNTTVLYGEGSNLLINTNGLDPIDQRGKLGTAVAAGAYTIDRWAVGAACTVTNTGSGVRFAFTNTLAAATSWGPLQRMENPESYSDKTLTLSGKIRASGGDIAYVGLYSNGTQLNRLEITSDGEWYEFSLTCSLGTISTNLYPVIGLYNATAGDYVEFQWMKLEFGSVATDFVPPDKTVETLRCKWFWQKLGFAVNSLTIYAYALAGNTTLCTMEFQQMRARPAVTWVGSWTLTNVSYYIFIAGSSSAGVLYCNASATGVVCLNPTDTSGIYLDAEI